MTRSTCAGRPSAWRITYGSLPQVNLSLVRRSSTSKDSPTARASRSRWTVVQESRSCSVSETTSTVSAAPVPERSEEHTSELQSRGHLVCRLLLEKKKKNDIFRTLKKKIPNLKTMINYDHNENL